MSDQIVRLDVETWKKYALKGAEAPDGVDSPESVLLVKDCAAEVKQANFEKREVTIVFSTESIDRDGDIIRQRGLDFEAFKKNPVVLFAHNSRDLPIGRAMKIFQTQNRTRSIAVDRFTPRDLNPLGDTVFQMLTAETPFLNAASIGFRPKQFERREGLTEEEEQQFFIPTDFQVSEKLEHSIVPVPANAEALQGAKSIGIDLIPIKRWAEQILDEDAALKEGRLSRKHLERCYDLCNSEKRSFTIPDTFFRSDDPISTPIGAKTDKSVIIVAPEAGNISVQVEQPAEPEPAEPAPGGQVQPAQREAGGQEKDCGCANGEPASKVAGDESVIMGPKGTTPRNPPGAGRDDPDSTWSAPRLSDFEGGKFGSGPFDERTTNQRRAVGQHFAWAEAVPPTAFGQLKLPHHNPETANVNLRGINAALAALNGARGGVDIPSEDRKPANSHLNVHRRAFGLDPIELRDMEEAEMKELLEKLAAEIAGQEKIPQEEAAKALEVAIEEIAAGQETTVSPGTYTTEELEAIVTRSLEIVRSKGDAGPEGESLASELDLKPAEDKGEQEPEPDTTLEAEFPEIKSEEEAAKDGIEAQISELRDGQRKLTTALVGLVETIKVAGSPQGEEPAGKVEDKSKAIAAEKVDDDVILVLADDEPETEKELTEGEKVSQFLMEEMATAVTRAFEEATGRLPN